MMSPERRAILQLISAAGSDADESWLARALPDSVRWRPRGPRSQRWMHGHLKTELGFRRLAPACSGLPHDVLALAALPSGSMRKLVEYLGLVVLGGNVRRAIAREDVLAYRQALGESAYAFTMERAPLLEAASPATSDLAVGPATILPGARRIGMLALRRGLSRVPIPVWRRVALKLPVSWQPMGGDEDSMGPLEGWGRSRLERVVRQVCREVLR